MDYKILDCTLRDGGYINEWSFGYSNIIKIIKNLIDTNIDIIECGFLNDQGLHDKDKTLFNSVNDLKSLLPEDKFQTKFVCMINYGEYSEQNLPNVEQSPIDGIRLAFHKRDINQALKACKVIADKGYKLFIQPMVTNNYNEIELLDMLEKVNKLEPYAFYIVDSFGSMNSKELLELYRLVDKHLLSNIEVGFHGHNNLQLAYSNAKSLIEVQLNRSIIVDASLYGMGRGAGNLNTELFSQYLNDVHQKNYHLNPIIEIIDQVISDIYAENTWGYSVPYYLSAMYNCHPNYASYLSNEGDLNIKDIGNILSKIPDHEKINFRKDLVDKISESL